MPNKPIPQYATETAWAILAHEQRARNSPAGEDPQTNASSLAAIIAAHTAGPLELAHLRECIRKMQATAKKRTNRIRNQGRCIRKKDAKLAERRVELARVANENTLLKASNAGLSSHLCDVQQDCIAMKRQRGGLHIAMREIADAQCDSGRDAEHMNELAKTAIAAADKEPT